MDAAEGLIRAEVDVEQHEVYRLAGKDAESGGGVVSELYAGDKGRAAEEGREHTTVDDIVIDSQHAEAGGRSRRGHVCAGDNVAREREERRLEVGYARETKRRR
jgi:hypothetical protein